MLRYLRFFINPLVMFVISIGLLFGGIWTWLPGIVYIAGVAIADQKPLQIEFRVEFDRRSPRLGRLLVAPLPEQLPPDNYRSR